MEQRQKVQEQTIQQEQQKMQLNTKASSGSCKVWLAIVGFLLGGPISFFFQNSFLQHKVPFEEYAIKAHLVLFDANSWSSGPFGNPAPIILITCVVCAVILGFIGSSIDKNKHIDDDNP